MGKVYLFVLFASLILLVTMGLRMSLGIFIQPILSDNPTLNIASLSLAMAVMQIVWGVSQPLSGILSHKFGTLKVLIGGTILLFVGLILSPFLVSTIGFVFTIGILIALGSGAGSFSILMNLVAKNVPPNLKGIASGVLNAGGSLGQFVFAPLIGYLIAAPSLHWQGAMFVLAFICLATLPLCYFLVRGENSLKQNSSHLNEGLFSAIKSAFRDRSYILLHLGFFTCGFHIAFLVTHLPTEISLCGLPPSVSSNSLAIIGLANAFGCVLVGYLSDKFRNKFILFFLYSARVWIIAIYLAELRFYEWGFYVFAALLGATWLATVTPTANITAKLFGTAHLATLFGLTLLSHQVGGFLGAYFGGVALQNLGDYNLMWKIDMLLAGLAALLNLPIREKRT